MRKRLLLLQLLLLFTTLTFAQPFIDIADFQYQAFTRRPYKDNPDASAAISTFKANLTFPLQMKSGTVFLLGFNHFHHFIDYRSDSANYRADLYSTALSFMMTFKLHNPKWDCLLLAVPKLNADFKDPLSTDLQMGGAVLFTWEKKENLKFKFGAYYNREFYGNYFMALLGIEWKVNDHINVYGVLPGSMNVEYRLNSKFYLTLAYRNANPTFRTTGNKGDSYVLDGHPFWGDAQVSTVLNYYPIKNITVYLGLGQTVFRHFEEYDKFKDKIIKDPALAPIRDQQFIYMGAAYRVRFD